MTFGGNNFNYFPENQCRPVPQYFNDWATKIIDWATFMSPSYYVKKYTAYREGTKPKSDARGSWGG